MQNLARRFSGWLRGIVKSQSPIPMVTERTSLERLFSIYSNGESFLMARYGVQVSQQDRKRSFGTFVRRHGLPPAQIVYMEIQLDARTNKVRTVSAREAKALVEGGTVKVLDVRESWERKHGSLPGAEPLDRATVDKLLAADDKTTPLLLYCHFGVRSMDAAAFFADLGFEQVHCLIGGIDAWAQDVDPSVPRYYENPC